MYRLPLHKPSGTNGATSVVEESPVAHVDIGLTINLIGDGLDSHIGSVYCKFFELMGNPRMDENSWSKPYYVVYVPDENGQYTHRVSPDAPRVAPSFPSFRRFPRQACRSCACPSWALGPPLEPPSPRVTVSWGR